LSNWVKKKLFFGISDRRMDVLLLGTQRDRALARSSSIGSAFRQRTVMAAPRVGYATSRLMEATAPMAITSPKTTKTPMSRSTRGSASS